MLEFLQITALSFSLMFFWTGTIFFAEACSKLKKDREAAKKFEELMKSKEFIKDYLDAMKGSKNE